MKRFIEGEERSQITLLPECLDDYIAEENPVRVVDVFVDELRLHELGFDGAEPAATGRPSYHPAVLLKIYIYGYLNQVQSSRRLEREAQRNVELMWLTGRLAPDFKTCVQSPQLCAYALQTLPLSEVAAVEAHLASCSHCQRELAMLQPVVDGFVAWPTDVLRPSASLQRRLAARIAAETGADPVIPPAQQWSDPEWEEVAPGILCKLLATDTQRHRVSMLVRLLPGVAYPAHVHAEVEELHLLDGELWIDGRKLYAGDYNMAVAPTDDQRVWSETGCTCVLITSTRDVLL